MSVRSIASLTCALTLAGAAPAFAACQLHQVLQLPVMMSGRQPLTSAKINGVDVMMLIDTGSWWNSMSPTTAADLKIPVGAMPLGAPEYSIGVGGVGDAGLGVAKTFTFAGFEIPKVNFIVTPGAGAQGLIGENLLGGYDVEYDLAHGVMRFLDAKGCENVSMAYWSKDRTYGLVRLYRSQYVARPLPIGEVIVNGVRLSAAFDTGAGQSILSLAAAKRAKIDVADAAVKPAGLTAGIGRRPVRVWIAPVASFEVGGEQIKNTKLMVGDFSMTGAADPFDMLLGADFFLSHRVLIANSQHQLYFTYNGGPVFDLTTQPAPAATEQASAESASGAPSEDAPKTADDYFRRGEAFLARQDLPHAQADLDKAVDLAPGEPHYLYERAQLRLRARTPALAMADLDAALKLKPDYVEALETRAQVRLGEHDVDGAEGDLDAVDHLSPQDANLRLDLGALYQSADRYDKAVTQFDAWVQTHGQDGRLAEALSRRCWSLALLNRDLDKALADCNRAVGLSPKTAGFLDSRGLLHLQRGENDKAIADYDAALALNPKIAWSLYGRGVAELRLGKADAGKSDLAAAAALSKTLRDFAKKHGVAPPAA